MAKLCLAGHFQSEEARQKWFETGRQYHQAGVAHINHVPKAIRALGYYYFRGDLELGVSSLSKDNERRARKIFETITRVLEVSQFLKDSFWKQIKEACMWRSVSAKQEEAYRNANIARSQAARERIMAARDQLLSEGKRVGVNAIARITGSNKEVISRTLRLLAPSGEQVQAISNSPNSLIVIEEILEPDNLGVNQKIKDCNSANDQIGSTPLVNPIKQFSLEPLAPLPVELVDASIANTACSRLASLMERCKNMAFRF